MALPSITLRNTKGSALTHTEMDTNLTNLQSANITVTANGTTSNIQLGSGFILSAGANIGLTNSAGNITITNTMPAGGGSGITDLVSDTSPQLGGDLDPNDHTYTAANIYSGHRFTLTGVGGSVEYSALVQGLKFTAPTGMAEVGVTFVSNAHNGVAAGSLGDGTNPSDAPGLRITNLHTAASAESSISMEGGNGSYGNFGLFKGVNSHYTHPFATTMHPGDGGMYVLGGDFHISPFSLDFMQPNPFVSGKVKFTALLDANPVFEFNLLSGDMNVNKSNIVFTTGKGITSAGALKVTSASNGNISITPNGTGNTVITNATFVTSTFPTLNQNTTGTAGGLSGSPTISGASITTSTYNKVTITAPATSATLTILDGKTLTTNNTITLAGTDATVMTFPSVSANIGYMNMPQVINNSSATFALSDQGKHYFTNTGGQIFTIPVNSVVPYPIGTVITIVNQSTSNVTVSGGGTSFYLAGSSSSKSTTTITTYGVATLLKTGTDMWFINGTGVV